MTPAEKVAAEAILRQLLLDTYVVGATWYPFNFTILFDVLDYRPHDSIPLREAETGETKQRQGSQVAIKIEARWAIYPVAPAALPTPEEELPRAVLDQQLAALTHLAKQPIVSVTLGDERPHLILEFAGGPLLFINGHHDTFECWNLSTNAPSPQNWLIVAAVDDNLDIFSPKV